MSTRSFKRKGESPRLPRRLRARTRASRVRGNGDQDAVETMDMDAAGGLGCGGDGRVVLDCVQVSGGGRDEWMIEDDWFRKTAVDTEEGEGKVEGGVVLFKLGGEWRQVPCHLWAWKSLAQQGVYKQCIDGWCDFRFNCLVSGHFRPFPVTLAYWDWIPKLIFTPAHIRDSLSLKSMSPRSLLSRPRKRRDAATLGAQVPPELLPLILDWVEGKLARTCRLVCRYWEKQCRERAFTWTDVDGSHKKVLELVQFKYDPAWRHIPSFVEQICRMPSYDDRSTRPWLHLLDRRWLSQCGEVGLRGPFAGRRTIRSIHFALPRSVPPSFSRGITWLSLFYVNFCSFEDTASLVSELPDLEVLHLYEVTWESLPYQLPHRRPRVIRNKLRKMFVDECKVEGVKSPSFLFPAFSLFLNVHSASSFFSPDIVTTADAILHLVSSGAREPCIAYNPDNRNGDIMDYLCFESRFASAMEPMLIFSSPKHDSADNNSIFVFIDFDHPHILVADNSSNKWAMLNTTINSLQRRTQFLFGFHDRERMIRFAADVVDDKLPLLSTRGEVLYTVAKMEKRHRDFWGEWPYWYQASLESEELQGKGTKRPWEVYT